MRLDDRSGEMAVFVHAVESGSFSAAGRLLGLTPSAVSKIIARIEARIGVSLLTRTTRSLIMTAEGEVYYRRCVRVLADIDEAEQTLSESAAPSGRLRVNASLVLGNNVLAPVLPEFLKKYPKVMLDLTLTDDVVDIIEQRVDVAIRIGPLRDSSLRARRLGESKLLVVASPDYLARHGTPQTPADLSRHNCLSFNFRRSVGPWSFATRSAAQPIAGNLEVSNGETLRLLALAGVGIARLAAFHVCDDIQSGQLIELFKNNGPNDVDPVHAVWIDRPHLAGRIRAFIDFLAESVSPRLVASQQARRNGKTRSATPKNIAL